MNSLMLVLNNCWTPYRSALFKSSDIVDRVYYLTERESIRNFKVVSTPKEYFLPSISIRNRFSPTQDLIISSIPLELINCDRLLVFGWSYWQIIFVLVLRRLLNKRTYIFFESTGLSRYSRLKRLFLSKQTTYLSPSLNSDIYLLNIYNGYNIKRLPNYSIYKPSLNKVLDAKRDIDILFVGRHATEKNIPFLQHLYATRGSSVMNFIGDSFPFVEESNQSDFIDNLEEIYLKSKFLVLPSLSEPYGMVAIEAWSCGCVPLVSSNCGVASELGDQFVIESVKDIFDKLEMYEDLFKEVLESLDRYSIEHSLKALRRAVSGDC